MKRNIFLRAACVLWVVIAILVDMGVANGLDSLEPAWSAFSLLIAVVATLADMMVVKMIQRR